MPKYKAKVILREHMFDSNRQLIEDDNALKALDGYFESPIEEIIAGDRHEVADVLLDKYENKLPRFASSQVVFSDDSPKD